MMIETLCNDENKGNDNVEDDIGNGGNRDTSGNFNDDFAQLLHSDFHILIMTTDQVTKTTLRMSMMAMMLTPKTMMMNMMRMSMMMMLHLFSLSLETSTL